jgi:hypothetical protein
MVILLVVLGVWMVAWVRAPAGHLQMAGRATWVLLIMTAWWLAGKVKGEE